MKNIFVSKKGKIIDVSKISSIEPNKKIGENYWCPAIIMDNGDDIEITGEDYDYLGEYIIKHSEQYAGWINKNWIPKKSAVKAETTETSIKIIKMFI